MSKTTNKKQEDGKLDEEQVLRHKQTRVQDDAKENLPHQTRSPSQEKDEHEHHLQQQNQQRSMKSQQNRQPNQFDIDKYTYEDDSNMEILKPTDFNHQRVEELHKKEHFTPSTVTQHMSSSTRELPEGKTTHTTRVVTTNNHERVIITKTITKVNDEEVAVHTRQITQDLQNKPIHLGVRPNLPHFTGNLSDRVQIKSTPLQPLNVLNQYLPEVGLPNPSIREPVMNLELDHLDPQLNTKSRPIDTKMRINYEVEEEAKLKAIKVVRPVDIEQRVSTKTTKLVRSIPCIVEQESAAPSTHSSFKATITKTKDGKTETESFSREGGDRRDSGHVDSEFLKSAALANDFSSQAAKEAQDIKTKGLTIVETLKKQVADLRQAAQMTNQGLEELDKARQDEVHARLNSQRLKIQQELEAKIAEEQELSLKVTSNAQKLRQQAADQVKAEYARIQGAIQANMDRESKELSELCNKFYGLENANLNKIKPWVQERMQQLQKNIEEARKQLEDNKNRCERVLAERLAACDAEARDRMDKIGAKLKDEIGQLRHCVDIITKEETSLFNKQRQADEDRMQKELQNQASCEKQFIQECKNQVDAEINAKIKEVMHIAKVRKEELDKQVQEEKAQIDKFAQENLNDLNQDKNHAFEVSNMRESRLKDMYQQVSKDIPKSWDSALSQMNQRLNALRDETNKREKELTEDLAKQSEAIKQLHDRRFKELKALTDELDTAAKARLKGLDQQAQKYKQLILDTEKTATDECQARIKHLKDLMNNSDGGLKHKYDALMKALNEEKRAHEEELSGLVANAEKRASELSKTIQIHKERLLENNQQYDDELSRCQAIVAEKERMVDRLREIEDQRKNAVLATEKAYSAMTMELELTRQALGSLRLGNQDIEAKTHQYAIESKGSRNDQVSQKSRSATRTKTFEIETGVEDGHLTRNIVNEQVRESQNDDA